MQKLSGGNIHDALENKKETRYWGVKTGRVTGSNPGDLGRSQARQRLCYPGQSLDVMASGGDTTGELQAGKESVINIKASQRSLWLLCREVTSGSIH